MPNLNDLHAILTPLGLSAVLCTTIGAIASDLAALRDEPLLACAGLAIDPGTMRLRVDLAFRRMVPGDAAWPIDGFDLDALYRHLLTYPGVTPRCACMPTDHLAEHARRDGNAPYDGVSMVLLLGDAATRGARVAALN